MLAHDIGCWRDRRDLEAGYFAQVLADRDAVRDGLVLVCSRSALDEDRLAEAAARAIAREREAGRQSLFVARLDGEVLGPAARDLARERVEGRRWREDWVRHVQAHPGFDFGAAGAEAYSRELRRLLRAVRRPARRSLPPARLPVFPH
jgi:hypothetical protein